MNDNLETKKSDLSFYGKDPGAVKHGNFINYYSFHDVKERINNLHPQMFPKSVNNRLICLDIGCNTGDLTIAVYEYLKTIYSNCDIYMLAIDIDPTLIERAKEFNSHPNITYITCNVVTDTDRLLIQNFLETHKTKTFDITFCFSVTMWIHLNNGDEGLLDFLKHIKRISKTIVIEPQPWKCYRNARRRLIKAGHSFEQYECLKIKTKVDVYIESTLIEGSFSKIYESPNSSWDRKVQSYQSTDT